MTRHTIRAAASAGALVVASALILTGCGGSGFSDAGGGASGSSGDLTTSSDPLTVMIGSSGDAETKAVNDAVKAWSSKSGTKATVVNATNLTQQLSQGFAAGSPPDVFYLSTDALAGYAGNGSLKAYGDQLSNKDDFYPSLVQNFTFDDQFYCAPKDFSTLQLIINSDLWAQAGLTEADIPTTWDQLSSVAAKLTTGTTKGLVFGGEYARIGAFMAEAGGGLVSADNTKATADDPANVDALEYVKQQLDAGSFAYAKDVGAGWGGEAFGKGLGVMTIEGNWITGALTADYPNVKYLVAELPAGPKGKGTLQFTNCWGMAADSKNQKAGLDLIEYLTSAEQQLTFSKEFGPMPSVQSAADEWRTENPTLTAFLDGSEYAQGVPTAAGSADVVADFNAQLGSLKTGDPAAILKTVQQNLQAIVK